MSSVTPGRETDAAVARALGWTRVDKNAMGYRPGFRGPPEYVPHYSTSPADALAALEALPVGFMWELRKLDEYWCELTRWHMRDGRRSWGESWVGNAPTLCTAICAAILAWSGAKGARPHAAGEGVGK